MNHRKAQPAPRTYLLAAVCLAALSTRASAQAAVATPVAAAPSTATDTYVPTLTYDVASVRQSNPDVNAGFTIGGDMKPETGNVRILNFDLENLLSLAYGADRRRIVGLPHWTFPTMFNIEAKSDSEAQAKLATLTKEQQHMEQQHMLQALLADRFKLQAHWETRDGPTYNLVVAKPGRMQESKGAPPSDAELKRFGDHPIPTLYQRKDDRGFDFVAHGASMLEIVRVLQGQMGRPVTDKTGLTGKYDFVLKYNAATADQRKADDTDPTLPLDEAIQDELGLKLESTKGTMQVLVLDHIEKPTEN
jgi:uncharacterized protein (TIGR03435 family)